MFTHSFIEIIIEFLLHFERRKMYCQSVCWPTSSFCYTYFDFLIRIIDELVCFLFFFVFFNFDQLNLFVCQMRKLTVTDLTSIPSSAKIDSGNAPIYSISEQDSFQFSSTKRGTTRMIVIHSWNEYESIFDFELCLVWLSGSAPRIKLCWYLEARCRFVKAETVFIRIANTERVDIRLHWK